MSRSATKALELYPVGRQSIKLRHSQKWLRMKMRQAFIEGVDFANQELKAVFEKETVSAFKVNILRHCTNEQRMELRDWLSTYEEKPLP